MKDPTFWLCISIVICVIEAIAIELLIRRIKSFTKKKTFYLKLKEHCAGAEDYLVIKAQDAQAAYNLVRKYYSDNDWLMIYPEGSFTIQGKCLNTIEE